MLPDPTLLDVLPLQSRSFCVHTHPLKPTHTHIPPPPIPTPCWGSKWSKITHSATQSLLCLALGTDCFIPQLFFPPSFFSLCSLLLIVASIYFFHTTVTLLKQEPVMVNCLTFLIVWWCFVVWPVSTWCSPIHQERLFISDASVCENWKCEMLKRSALVVKTVK